MNKRLVPDDIGSQTDSALICMPPQVESEGNGPASIYDFSRSGDMAEPQMNVIDKVSASFAAKLQGTLSGWLSADLAVSHRSSRQTAHAECPAETFEKAHLYSLRIEPLDGLALLAIDRSLALPIVDLLLGGLGDTASPHELTEIEEEILQSVTYRIIRELNAAWWTNGLRFEHAQPEVAESATCIRASAGRLLCVGFEMTLRAARGALTLCLPMTGLNALLRQTVAETGRSQGSLPLPMLRARMMRSGNGHVAQGSNLIAELDLPALQQRAT